MENNNTIPALFQPIKISDSITLPNRIGVSPMCMYSSSPTDNQATLFHFVHYGSFAVRGPALIILESTFVSENSGLSIHDLGLWNDDQAHSLRKIVDFIHDQDGICCIQLNHAGRKIGEGIPFQQIQHGWQEHCVGPSTEPFSDSHNTPRELTVNEINSIVEDFANAAWRAVEISKFDAIEIHCANGCLIHQFLSKLTNKRADQYGGSFENRVRFLLQIIENIKRKIETPIFLKFPMSDNCSDPEAWSTEDALKLADLVIDLGVKVIDVTSGGNVAHCKSRYLLNDDKQLPSQVSLARKLKSHIRNRCLIACSGGLDRDIFKLDEFIANGDFDIALIGKGFLKDTGLISRIADQLQAQFRTAPQYKLALS